MSRFRIKTPLGLFAAKEDGQSLVEFAVLLPFLLLALIGIVEFGNALSITHAMAGYSREGANIAARGTALDSVVAAMDTQGTEIQLDTRGGTIATRVRVEDGTPVVKEQVASPGWSNKSRVGQMDSTAVSLTGLGLLDNQSYWVVEVFYDYEPIGPLAGLIDLVTPGILYRWSLF